MNFTRLTIIKIVQLVIVLVLMGLHYHTWYGFKTEVLMTTGAIIGYMIICAGVLFGIISGTPVNQRIDMFFSVIGCIMFIVAGALIIDHRSTFDDDKKTAKGSLSIIEGILFAVDAVLTYKGET